MGIEEFAKTINKEEKKQLIRRANEIPDLPRFSTGSLSLDAECGSNKNNEAGFIVGGVIGLTGEESSGKTVIAVKAAGEYLKRFPKQGVLWVDAEGTFTPAWARTLGLDVDDPHVMYMAPEYTEQAFNAVLKAVDSNVGLIVIDSLGALSPKTEMESEIEGQSVGIAAKLNRKLMRNFVGTINDPDFKYELPSTLIYINHLNEKFGGMATIGGGIPLTEPGGRALKFFPSIKIRVRKGDQYPKSKSVADEGVEPKAQEIKFHVEKNKTAPPFRRGHVWFYFDTLDEYRRKGEYDTLEEAIRYGKKYDLIKQRGKMYDVLDPATGELVTFEGSIRVAEFLRSNQGARQHLEQDVIKRVRGDMIEHGEPLSQDEGDDKEKRGKSSKGTEGQETTSVGSDTVEEGRHTNGSVLGATQRVQAEISLDELSGVRAS